MHDQDRILYSSALSSLAGKTQVVATSETGGYHNRLTHSLKVQQLGRRIAELLRPESVPGPDPDLVSAACLAHDIGHPPFGHAGEDALRKTYARLDRDEGHEPPDAFQGNAQNLRILTFLAARKYRTRRGLHLTRAALDATIKYPWYAGDTIPNVNTMKKFGIYRDDRDTAEWIFPDGLPDTRPVEEQIMDWADGVTYACHDVEDFFRAGVIPLDRLLDFPPDRYGREILVPSPELELFLTAVESRWDADPERGFDRDHAITALARLSGMLGIADSYRGDYESKLLAAGMTSQLIVHFLTGIHLTPTGSASAPQVRYAATLTIPPDLRFLCDLLKELIWFYVIDAPGLGSQQHGQARIVTELLEWHHDEPRLLPRDRRDEAKAPGGNLLRAACDHVASLTESQAMSLHHRMSGIKSGAVTDRLS
jgi:dGTPase